MSQSGGGSLVELKRESTITSVLYWCVGSVVFALVIGTTARGLLPPWQLWSWLAIHAMLAVAALGTRLLAERLRERGLTTAEALLIVSALAWGIGGIWFGQLPDVAYNMPIVVTVAGLAAATIWLFGAQFFLMIGVLVVMLTPILFRLMGGAAAEWAGAALIVMLVIGHLLISRRLMQLDAAGLDVLAPSIEAEPPAEAKAEASSRGKLELELVQLRTEIERHRGIEKEMEAAKQAAEAANMAKGEFLATMSHEMRTPLNGIIPLLEILRDTKLDVDQRDYLNTAYQSARHMLRIIDDILDYSKIEANKLELETVGLNLKEVVDSVVRMMEKAAEAKGLKISVSFDPNVRLAGRGDPVRLRQVLSNLVSNAIKFTERGSIAIQVSRKGETRSHSEVMFAVRDTGVGIAPEKAERLFKPFSQADTSTTRTYGGTGLGLVICKRIVELMEGKIGLKSEVSKGSVFWFSVPILKAIGDMSSNRRDLAGSRALVVTTDARLVQRLQSYFQNWNVSAIATNTTADALSKLKSSAALGENWAFDVAVVDFSTMRATAPALARNVSREPVLSRLKLLFIEGDDAVPADVQDRDRSASLARQFSETDLMSTLNRLLEIEQAGEQRFSLHQQAAMLGGGEAQAQAAPREAERREQAAAPAAAASSPAPAAASAAAAGPTTGHALLVEDNPVNRQVAQRLLGLIGITYDIAENGKEAFDMMGKGRYDVILMDCQMPIMDGYTATRSRRTMEQERNLPRIPIIAMTANAMAGDREKCLASGMDDYMSKPLNRGLLEQTIRKWLPKERKPAASIEITKPAAPASAGKISTEPVKMTASGPAINEDIVNELLDVMGSEFTALVKVYLEDTPKNLRILNEAADRGDVQAMIAPAHSLKSTSANLGAMALSDLAKLVEHGARAGTLRDAQGMARQASVEFRRAAEELHRILNKAGI